MSLVVPPEIEEKILYEAKVRGMEPDAILREMWLLAAQEKARNQERPENLTPEEFSEILERMAARIPPHPPLSPECFSRESIYTREDEML